jgi:hypothetical protein
MSLCTQPFWISLHTFFSAIYFLIRPVLHCKGNSVYIFLFWELRVLSPNFYIHVSVGNLYIPRIGPHISSSRNGSSTMGIYNSLTDTWMWKLGLRPRYSFSGNICFKFSAFFLCSVSYLRGKGSLVRVYWNSQMVSHILESSLLFSHVWMTLKLTLISFSFLAFTSGCLSPLALPFSVCKS